MSRHVCFAREDWVCPKDHSLIDQVVKCICRSSVIGLVLGRISYDADVRVFGSSLFPVSRQSASYPALDLRLVLRVLCCTRASHVSKQGQ